MSSNRDVEGRRRLLRVDQPQGDVARADPDRQQPDAARPRGPEASHEPAGPGGSATPGSGVAAARWRAALISLVILAVCVATAFALIETGPVAERAPRPRQARLVEVTPAVRSTEVTEVAAMGTVVATREVVIQPQATGRIVEVSPEFVPGGRFAPGELMLRIDPSDYELAVRQRESELAQARAELQIEAGNQSVARLEYELLGEAVADEDRDLVLRQPQLETVRARVASAAAAVAQARLDLERTAVRAPFHSLVRERGAELGARVDPGTPLATLVATDAYWVEVVVPVSQLRWIEIPNAAGEPGSPARVADLAAWGPGAFREGRVVRLLGDLESEGRMARLLVRVEDPLALQPDHAEMPRLLLDSFVNVQLQGRLLADVVALDRALLRDGDRVWILGEDGALEIRAVTVTFRSDDRVLVSDGLAGGELLVTSELSSPVPGMPLRTAEPAPGDRGAEAPRGG